MSESTDRRPRVTVLSGFLGAGKTTLLRRMLDHGEGRRWAAVVNDVAEINVDAQTVASAGRSVIGLGNGCVCCTVRDELAETIARLASEGGFERIWVETTGVADPRSVADLFVRRNSFGRSLADFAVLEALVTVVDVKGFLAARAAAMDGVAAPGKKPVFELMLDQVECADAIVVNKCDLATPEELRELEESLLSLNSRAEIFRAEFGEVAGEALVGRQRFDAGATLGAAKWLRVLAGEGPGGAAVARSRNAPLQPVATARHEAEYGVGNFVYVSRRPFVRERFFSWLQASLPTEVLRAKGVFWVAEQPEDIGFLSVAGGRARTDFVGTWAAALLEGGVISPASIPASAREKWSEPGGDRRQELVFIGTDLNADEIRAALDHCLGETPAFERTKFF